MKRSGLLSLLALLTLLLCSCLPGPRRQAAMAGYGPYAGEGGEIAYDRALNRWTDELKLYSRWETTLLMRATFKSKAFRKAHSFEYARRYILPKEEYDLLLEQEIDDAASFHEVFFAVWANDTRHGDFGETDPPWAIRLVGDEGRTVQPLLVRPLRRPSTEILTLFPYITPHDKIFVAKFPVLAGDGLPLIGENSRFLTMQVAGVKGRGELRWRLRRKDG